MAERGSAALELSLGVLVLLVPMAVLVLSFGPSLEARSLARAMAADLSTSLVMFDGALPPEHVDRLANRATGAGFDPARIEVAACGQEAQPLREVPGCPLFRGGVIEVAVAVEIDRPVIGGPTLVTATSRIRVPEHRSAP